MNNQIFTPEAYGAVADGRHNDGAAFWKAIDEAAVQGGTVQLQPNSTYYIARKKSHVSSDVGASANMKSTDGGEKVAAIVLDGVDNLMILGENTTILIDAPLFFCNINNTRNVTLQGLNFNYRIKPFAGAHTLSIDMEHLTADIVTDRSLQIEDAYDASTFPAYFGVLDRPDGRWHMFITGYDVLDKDTNTYRVHFKQKDKATVERVGLLLTTRLIVPMPRIGHRIERAFSIVGNTDFTMKDCNIWSVARFMFAIFRSEGIMRFENVNIVPEPGDNLPIVGWRDGYHVKENRAKFIWKNCRAQGLFDDVFNISASMLNVQTVYAPDDIDLFWGETKKVYAALMPGDTLTVINVLTGELIGSTSVREVVLQEGSHNRIRLSDPLPGVIAGEHIKVCFDCMVAPNSEIVDCDFRGTTRFRGPISIRDSHFYVLRMWIDVYSPYEGPIPASIHFTNCDFDCDDDHDVYFHLESQRKGNSGKNQYHLNDVLFDSCRLNQANFETHPVDKPYVRFI